MQENEGKEVRKGEQESEREREENDAVGEYFSQGVLCAFSSQQAPDLPPRPPTPNTGR